MISYVYCFPQCSTGTKLVNIKGLILRLILFYRIDIKFVKHRIIDTEHIINANPSTQSALLFSIQDPSTEHMRGSCIWELPYLITISYQVSVQYNSVLFLGEAVNCICLRQLLRIIILCTRFTTINTKYTISRF